MNDHRPSRADDRVDPATTAPLLLAAAFFFSLPVVTTAQETPAREKHQRTPQSPAADPSDFSPVQQRGIDFLMKNQEGGRFFMAVDDRRIFDDGLTGLALAAMQGKPVARRSKAEAEVIRQGLEHLLAAQSKAGAFGRRNVNYSTSAVVLALAKANDPALRPAMQRARSLLAALQNTEAREFSRGDRDYGSFGYGGDERGDLSNTNFALTALRAAGMPAGEEHLAKAQVFLQRLQNLSSVNDFTTRVEDPTTGKETKIVPGDDGGATYSPGASPAGFLERAGGTRVPRSYGSMTYALLKTYTLCGVGKDDPRVRAALTWAERNWSVDHNPGADPALGAKARYQGLFYYYMVMAEALDLVGIDRLRVPAGSAGVRSGKAPQPPKGGDAQDGTDPGAEATPAVDWRRQLREKLAALQREDGAWVNAENDRWYEGVPIICTTYALLALEHCR